jgi:hypothetical protein
MKGVTQRTVAEGRKLPKGVERIAAKRRAVRDEARGIVEALPGSVPFPLVGLRDHHHKVARLMAQGMSSSEIAAVVGLGVTRVSQLRHDPAIAALIVKYGERYDAIDEQMYATRRVKEELILHHALDGMIEKYETSPHEISHEQRRLDYALVTERLDGQVVKPSVVLHGNVSDMPLADLVRLQRARADKMLAEAQPEPGSLLAPVSSSADTGSGSVASQVDSTAALPTPVPASNGNGE